MRSLRSLCDGHRLKNIPASPNCKGILNSNNLANPHNSVCKNLRWEYSLYPQESHRILTEICIWHLLFTEFETDPLGENMILSQYVNNHIFLDYSAKNWATHFRKSYIKDDTVIQSLLRICNVSSNCCLTWFRIYWTSTHTDFPKNFTTLMITSYFGLRAVVEILLRMDSISINSKDSTHGRSALSWAAGNGFDTIVKLLIKSTRSRLKSILKLAFKKREQIESVDRYGRTPLSHAA
jgi:ankyrin repeat domain-containing protein 50